ncbi:MAG: NADH-quinone oxidoreductase subunit I [Bacteroidetes bacterium]|nr:NADH-quinone oxidoreductase subunit I [Bacteroidota bacterium]
MLKYFKDIYKAVITPIQGMKITSSYIATPRVTRKYPESYTPVLPETERNKIEVDIEKCTGCQLCAKNCLTKSINIETMKTVPTDTNVPLDAKGKPKKMLVTKFNIDFGTCCFCALCEESCNFKAIYRTPKFDYSDYYRKNLVYNFSQFTPEQIEEKRKIAAQYQAEQKAATNPAT